MEELLALVRQLGAKAPNHPTLQTKSGAVAKSLSAAAQAISNEETVKVYQMFRLPVEKVKINDPDSAIQVLEQIQVAMDPQIRARAAVRNKALDNLWDGGAAIDPTESLTVRLSLASKDSLAASELQAKLQGFYNELGQFEQKLRQADEPGSPHASILSQASLLRSVLESESPLDRVQAQSQIENFMAKLEQMRTEMAKGNLLQSEQGSTFSSESVVQDPLASPVRPKGPPSASWLSEASNADGPGVREWLDKMYETLGKLETNLKTNPPLAPSVHQSAFESQSELGDGVNQQLPDLPGKLDFKKSQSIGGKKGGLTIEVDSQQGAGAPKELPKQHPQSTKHLPAIKADKRLSGSRQYISTGRQIGKSSDPEDELDAELEDKRQHSAGNEDLEDDDQSLFSNKTPRYFYELRAGDAQGDTFKQAVPDFDGLPLFASNEKQPEYAAQVLEGNLQFEQTKLLLAKSAAKQTPVRTSADFLDPDFKPWFLSVVGDPSNSDNLGLTSERRLQWKRAKYLGLAVGSDTAVRLWLPEPMLLPQRELSLSHGMAETPIVANLLSSLLVSDLLPKGLSSFLGEADPHTGKYTFVLHDQQGRRVRVQVDDFLPCVSAISAKFSPDNLGFLGPITLTGLEGLSDSRVEKVHFLLPCLLEKALAKLFGNYVSLHRAHPATLLQALLGGGVYSFQISKPLAPLVSQGLQSVGSVFAQRSRPSKTKAFDRVTYSPDRGLQVGERTARDVAALKDSHQTLLLHGNLPGLSLAPVQFALAKAAGGLGLKLADGVSKENAHLGISFKYASTRGCAEAVYYHELLGSKNLQECYSDHGPVLQSSDWVLPWSSLPEEELFLVTKASPDVDIYVGVSQGVQVRELDAAEVSKVKRGVVKKHNNQQPEMLKEFFTLSHPVNGSVTFKIHNPELIKGKLGTLVGALHKRDWMIEHNGVEVSLKPTTVLQPVPGKSPGLQQLEHVNLLVLEGIDVETLRVYPARRTPWSSAIERSTVKSLAEQLEQIRLVFN